MINKSELRKILIEKRRTIDTNSLSKVICEKITKLEVYKSAKTIFAYYPLPYEVDISVLFKDKTKNWFLPKVSGEDMEFYRYTLGDKLVKGKFGVYEPVSDNISDLLPDLIIVPALSVDKNNYRLGYGKGFYDRFLAKYEKKQPLTLTPIFSELVVCSLPVDNFDKKIDIIITD